MLYKKMNANGYDARRSEADYPRLVAPDDTSYTTQRSFPLFCGVSFLLFPVPGTPCLREHLVPSGVAMHGSLGRRLPLQLFRRFEIGLALPLQYAT